MTDPNTTYQSYLLRLWNDDESSTEPRAMLVDISDPEETCYFKDVESLMMFLLDCPDAPHSKDVSCSSESAS